MASSLFLLLFVLCYSTARSLLIPYNHNPDATLLISAQLSEDFTGSLDTSYESSTSYRVVISCLHEDKTPDIDDVVSIRVQSQIQGEESLQYLDTSTGDLREHHFIVSTRFNIG
jgi:hypothetical protein